jgi:hypothetical protein
MAIRDGKLTQPEREYAIERLNSSRRVFLDALAGVSKTQAVFHAEDRWSVLEYAEHVAVSEGALMDLVKSLLAAPAQPELMEKAAAMDGRMRKPGRSLPRGVNQAPAHMRPHARFGTIEEAVAHFEQGRARTLRYAEETQDPLRLHFAPHPIFGPMDGYQWMLANAVHSETHSRHIGELKAHPEFPAA